MATTYEGFTRSELDTEYGGYRVDIGLEGSPHVYRFNLHPYRGEMTTVMVAVQPREGTKEPVAITAPVLRELADRFERLEKHAHATTALWGADVPNPAIRVRRELSPAFLREIERRHAEHRSAGRSPTATLAREERVAPTTVKHWLRRAKELGAESD